MAARRVEWARASLDGESASMVFRARGVAPTDGQSALAFYLARAGDGQMSTSALVKASWRWSF